MNSNRVFEKCAEIQQKLFCKHFLSNNRTGEIVCVNALDNEDSFMFERFEVSGVHFIATYRLLGEDSLITEDFYYDQKPVAHFVEIKRDEIKQKYDEFLNRLRVEKKTLAQAAEEIEKAGGDPSSVDYKEFTRDMLEDTMHPGRRRINGDRNTRIQVLYRQTEIPNDLQKAALNVYELPMPDCVLDLLPLITEKEREEWKEMHLEPNASKHDLGCHLPFLKTCVDVLPVIYRFPERELDVERVANI